MAIYAVNFAALKLRGRTFYQALNLGIAVFDFWFGSRPPSLHRWFNMYGTIIRCAKAQPADWTALQ